MQFLSNFVHLSLLSLKIHKLKEFWLAWTGKEGQTTPTQLTKNEHWSSEHDLSRLHQNQLKETEHQQNRN